MRQVFFSNEVLEKEANMWILQDHIPGNCDFCIAFGMR